MIQSLTRSVQKITKDTNGFPIWDPDESSDNDVIFNDSNITVTENSFCEGMKSENFNDLQYFTPEIVCCFCHFMKKGEN